MINLFINSNDNHFLANIDDAIYTTGSWSVTLVQDYDNSSGSFDVDFIKKTGYNDEQAIFNVSGSNIVPSNFGQYTLTLSEYIQEILTWAQANLIYSQTSLTWSNVSGKIGERPLFVDRAFIQSGSNEIPVYVYFSDDDTGTFTTYNDL